MDLELEGLIDHPALLTGESNSSFVHIVKVLR